MNNQDNLIMALRLWYYSPWIKIEYEQIVELYKFRPLAERQRSQTLFNYPTCLCVTCGHLEINTIEGFMYPLRQKCGLDNTEQQKDMKEKLSKLNTYVMGSLGRTIASLGRDFYDGGLLEAFDNMNMPF